MVVIVMGVTGCGKTTVGTRLASDLGWPFYDADDFHPPENKAKMAPVKTGPVQDEKTVVESGVSPGDRIIVGGQYRLQPKSAVQFEEPRVSATEPAAPPKAVTQ